MTFSCDVPLRKSYPYLPYLAGCVALCYKVKQHRAWLVHGWMTVTEVRRTEGVLMQPKNCYRMTLSVRHSGIVN